MKSNQSILGPKRFHSSVCVGLIFSPTWCPTKSHALKIGQHQGCYSLYKIYITHFLTDNAFQH